MQHSDSRYIRASPQSVRVAVVMERRALANRWQSESWQPVAVVPDEPDAAPRVVLDEGDRVQWLHPGFEVVLHRDEAEGYYLNLTASQPYMFVMWRRDDDQAVPKLVTPSYHEAARLMDGGAQVDGVGWCPRGRRAVDGPLSNRYPLTETPSADYAQRTEWNVRDADATLILHRGALSGGTLFTAEQVQRYGRPLLALDLDENPEPLSVWTWMAGEGVRVLNVAGPREENAPGIYLQAKALLTLILAPLAVASQSLDPSGGEP